MDKVKYANGLLTFILFCLMVLLVLSYASMAPSDHSILPQVFKP